MKHLLTAVAACVLLGLGTVAQAQDEYKFADTVLSLQQVTAQWHDQNLYTAGWDESPTIRNYFVGLATTYPTDLFHNILYTMLGFNTEGVIGDYVLDEKNGFISGKLLSQIESAMQMCYWRCNDGNRLVGVAVMGDEFSDAPVPEDDPDFEVDVVCINDLMFFRIEKDELIWRPVSPRSLLGRDYNFAEYEISLPRQGKDITLTNRETGKVTKLTWNGARFSAAK